MTDSKFVTRMFELVKQVMPTENAEGSPLSVEERVKWLDDFVLAAVKERVEYFKQTTSEESYMCSVCIEDTCSRCPFWTP